MTRRILFSIALVLLAILLSPAALAHAEPPYRPSEGTAASRIPPPEVCNDAHELASVTQAEGRNQPLQARIAIMQIVHAHAMRLGLTICALTRLTGFVSVRHYAIQHPDSWTARQFANPEPSFVELASAVLAGELERAVPDAYRHFDGVSHNAPEEINIGQTWFRY